MNRIRIPALLLTAGLALALTGTAAAKGGAWKYLEKPDDWYRGAEAAQVAANILSYQSAEGSWPKNIDTTAAPFAGDPADLKGTFDNGATTDELRYLARIYQATQKPRYRQAFLKGLDHILRAQYPSGGWPQFYPPDQQYHRYITFNDNAMVRLMVFLREVFSQDRYDFVDDQRRREARSAFDRGIECILKCQVRVHGQRTAWCAQHDEKDYRPRPGRSYELVSLSGDESLGIVRLLMSLEDPGPDVMDAVEGAVAWFEAVKLPGIKVVRKEAPGTPKGYNRVVVKDPAAPPMWARFYEIGTNRPIFADRDGVPKQHLADIGYERRNGYTWLGYWPQELLAKEYPAWKTRWAGRAGKNQEEGFVPMFNGRDLTGWVNVNCAPATFFVKDGMIITTGKPTGYLRTDRQYENFIADFEWMHVPPAPGAVGNSGFFVWADPLPAIGTGYTRGIEVQVLVNLEYRDKKTGAIAATSHGDLFRIWGATCVPARPHPLGWARSLPSENRARGANEWNHYRVEANDGVIQLAVNGKVVSTVRQCRPRKGYLALESEGSECRFRNLKIKELPSTHPKKEETAELDQGYHSLFDGLTLEGWKTEVTGKRAWTINDGVLAYHKPDEATGSALEAAQQYGDGDLLLDIRLPKQQANQEAVQGQIYLGRGVTILPQSDGLLVVSGPEGEIAYLEEPKFTTGEWNRVQATLQGDRLTVRINGKTVVANERVKKLKPKGWLAIAGSGDVEFRNIFLRELK
ncbi:MAG: pectate lyase [Planctomycetes bacterium]|nr:pectate lyase [Planctomycetota bacterium]